MTWLLAVAITLGATVYDETFAQAVAAQEAEDFASAIAQYEQIAAAGVQTPALYLNLGNAYYRSGNLGAAIANYERVLKFDPGHAAARTNLLKTLNKTERRLEHPDPRPWVRAIYFWHGGVSAGAAQVAALLLWALGWLVLILRQWRPWPFLRGVAAAAFAVAFILAGAVWVKVRPEALAVTTAERAEVRVSTRADATTRFELFAGDRVVIEEEQEDWVRVRTADDSRGWLPRRDIVRVWPPERPAPAPMEDPPA